MSDGEKAGSTANAESTARRLILKRCEYDFISGASLLGCDAGADRRFRVRMGTPLGCCLCKFRLAALEFLEWARQACAFSPSKSGFPSGAKGTRRAVFCGQRQPPVTRSSGSSPTRLVDKFLGGFFLHK